MWETLSWSVTGTDQLLRCKHARLAMVSLHTHAYARIRMHVARIRYHICTHTLSHMTDALAQGVLLLVQQSAQRPCDITQRRAAGALRVMERLNGKKKGEKKSAPSCGGRAVLAVCVIVL